jgi:hypothetical protein
MSAAEEIDPTTTLIKLTKIAWLSHAAQLARLARIG